jgi:hypothetical protein
MIPIPTATSGAHRLSKGGFPLVRSAILQAKGELQVGKPYISKELAKEKIDEIRKAAKRR